MQTKEVLEKLNLGNSVAEFDSDLKKYFVETQAFRALISGDKDVIAGDKGTGKTALYKVLTERAREFRELRDVEIVSAFNPTGNPVFQRLTGIPVLSEGQYITIWKGYILSLIGNWLLEFVGNEKSRKMLELEELLIKIEMRTSDDSASTVFSKITNLVRRVLRPESVELGITFTEAGMPILLPKIEFGEIAEKQQEGAFVEHESALRILNDCLAELDTTIWLVLDRLDEAFQGHPDIEKPALRALFRTYLDMLEFDRLKLKLFVRKDLFRKITDGGFVNLTHINAKKLEIVWDEDDLRSLLGNRIKLSREFIKATGSEGKSAEELFYVIFPAQVDGGPRKPNTWGWMMSRIRDGNAIKPPRNLVDLAKKAQENQLRAEDRNPKKFAIGQPLVEADSIRKALHRLSDDRVNDTLIAEAANYAPLIEKFRDKKAEHNIATLSELLGVPGPMVRATMKPLVEMGFVEETGETYKVPILYREGLHITQGKAFAPPNEQGDEDAEG